MNGFFFLLLFLVFAMIVGPILLIKPSKRQQRIAQLRAKAPSLGLRVTLQTLNGQSIAVYEKPWPRDEQQKFGGQEWLLEKQSYQHDIHFCDWWAWRGPEPSDAILAVLKQRLADLPDAVVAVEANRLGLRCYWTERGNDATLNELAEWLSDVATSMWLSIRRQETLSRSDSDQLDSDY